MAQFDTLIKGGTVVDGTGAAARTADIAITDGVIRAVGRDLGSASETVNADGLIVTPGWVDIHTHYDGQAMWDPVLSQSLWHGVTTAVMGNCGVGFAPASPDRHDWLIGLMESVEDISGISLAAGLPWNWETFPEYLNALAAIPRTFDLATMITHGPLRTYVMGDRGARNEAATADDMATMARLTTEAVRAGAVGFSTSRTLVHVARDGTPVPGTYATEEELIAITNGIRAGGRGLMEIIGLGTVGEDIEGLDRDMQMMKRIAEKTECPVMFLLAQNNADAQQWKRQLSVCEDAAKVNAPLIPQVGCRPVKLLFCIEGEHPFSRLPSFQAIADLPLAERIARMRMPELRARLLAEEDPNTMGVSLLFNSPTFWEGTYVAGEPINHMPDRSQCVAEMAKKEGRSPREVAYDLFLEKGGRAFLMYCVTNYAEANPDACFEGVRHPLSVFGISDAGAHTRFVCDGGVHSYVLTQYYRDWGKDHKYHLPLEYLVKKLTADNAKLFAFNDRGVLAPGKRADINLIDLPRLRAHMPEMLYDLPADMPRLVERADGYVATYVKGKVIQKNGQETGARPGGLLRAGRS